MARAAAKEHHDRTVPVMALWRFRSGHGALFVAIAALVFLIVHLPWSWAAITGAEKRVSVQPRAMARHALPRAAGDHRSRMGHLVQATISPTRID